MEPTIVEAQPDWELVQRETFVPILYVMRYRSLDDAIAMNNRVDQGLSSAIFTTDVRQAGILGNTEYVYANGRLAS